MFPLRLALFSSEIVFRWSFNLSNSKEEEENENMKKFPVRAMGVDFSESAGWVKLDSIYHCSENLEIISVGIIRVFQNLASLKDF